MAKRWKILKTALLVALLASFISSPCSSQVKVTPQLSSWNAGELNPRLDNRSDLEKYFSGARTMQNFVPLVEGAARRMPGTYFVLETKDSTQQSRLIPFQFSTIQSYIIEAGDEYFRFYKDGGQIVGLDAFTKLLLHMDGLEGSTTFTDSVGTHSPVANGDAQVDTSQQKFGTGSGAFDGNGDYVSIADHANWDFGSNAFVIDFRVRFDVLPVDGQTMYLVSQWVDADNHWSIYVQNDGGTYTLRFRSEVSASVEILLNDGTYAFATDTWYHVAVIRGWGASANSFALIVNGTSVETETDTSAMPTLAGDLYIGQTGANTKYLNGRIDELRISSGMATAYWTANFVPPTQEYPFIDSGLLQGGGSSAGGAYEVTTPYQAEDVFGLKFTQSADYLYITHPDYPPKTLTRTSHTSWTLADFVAGIGTQMTITGISQAATAVVTCSNVPTSLAEGDIVYIQDVVGMTEVNDTFFTTGTVVTGAGGTFQLSGINSSAYTAYSSGGTADETQFGTTDNNPASVTFFEQRLAMSATNNEPQTFWMSASAGYSDFTQDADDDSAAIQYTIASNRVDRIRWMVGQDFLFLGTVGGTWKVGASSTDDPITASNITAKKQGSTGVKNIPPEPVSDAILWVSRAGTAVRQISYYYLTDKYESLDMTRLASHIAIGDSLAESGIEQLAFQQEPQPILWAVRADGQLLGMTYEIQEQVYSWFRVVTDGEFESVAVISEENEEDQVWVIVKRTIDGSDVRYVEYFKPHEFYGDIEEAFFVHSGLTWDGASKASFSGLDHLEGETVSVLADGVALSDETVSSGAITIDTAGSKVHIGLPYTSILEPMKLAPQVPSGAVRGKKQRINKLWVNFYQTGSGVQYGPSQSDLYTFNDFTSGSLTTDAFEVTFPGGWTDEAAISIVQSKPLPVTVLGIVPWLTINESQ